MRLCDSLVFDHDHDQNRCPSGPWRSANPFRCFRCGGWLGHGRLLEPPDLKLLAGEATSLLGRLLEDYPYVHDLAHSPTRRPQNGRSGVVGDPTGNHVGDPRRARIRAYGLVVDRLVERAVRDLRHADEAAGDALYAAEPPGPAGDIPSPYGDPIPANRPDLEDAHAARGRRRGRGEL
jgi:hypothetical protein